MPMTVPTTMFLISGLPLWFCDLLSVMVYFSSVTRCQSSSGAALMSQPWSVSC